LILDRRGFDFKESALFDSFVGERGLTLDARRAREKIT